MGKKLTNKQQAAVRRTASNLRLSDQVVESIVSEFLAEQSARPQAKRTAKKSKK